jgi:hypothetical protein
MAGAKERTAGIRIVFRIRCEGMMLLVSGNVLRGEGENRRKKEVPSSEVKCRTSVVVAEVRSCGAGDEAVDSGSCK